MINKEQLIKQTFDKFLLLYNDIEAIAIIDLKGTIFHIEKRRQEFIKTLEGLTNYLKPRIAALMHEESKFKKYGIAFMDSTKYRHLFISINENRILYFVLKQMAPIDKIEPYALFLAEKISQILTSENNAPIQTTMPSFQFESGIFEKYKRMIGFEVGGIYRFKFCIIGDNFVGKTSLVRRFVENKFDKDYRSTIGLNIVSHNFHLLNNEINVVIWDMGGQQYYHRFRQQYYLGSQVAFIVFDLTNRESYDNAKNYWYEELRTFIKQKALPIVLIGNKSDLEEQRKVTFEEGQNLADELSEIENSYVSYIETSALSGENIKEAFKMVSYQYIIQSKEEEAKVLQEKLYVLINEILEKKPSLSLVFFSESFLWSPAIRILTGINKLGKFKLIKDDENEKIYQFDNGLILKNYIITIRDISDCDGIYCIFDAIGKEHIDPKWRELIVNIIKTIKENTELLVGIRVTKDHNWSQLLEEFNLNEELEKKMANLSFYELRDEFQLDIYDQLKNMLNSIKFFA
ncbi:MAG: Rab family GTPase [Promethearchaeota archaeon]